VSLGVDNSAVVYSDVILKVRDNSQKLELEIGKAGLEIGKSDLEIGKSDLEIGKRRNFVFGYIKRKWDCLSNRQIVILCVFSLVDLLAAAVVSIQAPFYPEVVR